MWPPSPLSRHSRRVPDEGLQTFGGLFPAISGAILSRKLTESRARRVKSDISGRSVGNSVRVARPPQFAQAMLALAGPNGANGITRLRFG